MTDELKGRKIFTWRGQDDDVKRLAAAIAEACTATLFELNGHLVHLSEGLPVPVSRNMLAGVIAKHIAGIRLVNPGEDWKAEHFTFDFAPQGDTARGPNDQTLTEIAAMLVGLVAKGPRAAPRLTSQQKLDITSRLKTGEPKQHVADAYHLDLEQLEEVRRLAG